MNFELTRATTKLKSTFNPSDWKRYACSSSGGGLHKVAHMVGDTVGLLLERWEMRMSVDQKDRPPANIETRVIEI